MRKAIFPASLDPIHLGHCDIARRAAEIFDEVIVGVYDKPATKSRMLFSAEERLQMAREALAPIPRLRVATYSGLTVDFAKEVGARFIVRGLRVFSDFELEFRMALANRRLNPDIEMVALITSENHMHLASSTIREIASLGGNVSTMVPPNVEAALLAHFAKLGDDARDAVETVSLRD
ncbi:MAG: pantetheine-phosphate adenylyltransferase [Anaerolineae bacterium]|nr:pantetheine-phosphate adenylyltransferase [Anaerolineae bacterium]